MLDLHATIIEIALFPASTITGLQWNTLGEKVSSIFKATSCSNNYDIFEFF